jgi:Zn-dependent peptidase ImmA (M78 family)
VNPAAQRALIERDRLGVGSKSSIADLLELVEEAAEVPVVVEQLGPDGIDGAFAVKRGVPFILLNGAKPLVRLRFTLAHEYGHHVLGHGLSVDKVISFSASQPQKEVQANAFAAEFLLPLEALDFWLRSRGYPNPDLSLVAELARDFQVSAQVALYRMQSANRLSARAVREIEQAIQAGDHQTVALPHRRLRRDSLRDARTRQRRLPADVECLLLRALERDLLDAGQVARRLRLAPEQVATRLAAVIAAGESEE